MAITIDKQPNALSPVYSNTNILKIHEASATYFTLVLNGDVTGTFKIDTDINDGLEFNLRYVLSNFIDTHIVRFSDTTLQGGLITYNINITSSTGSVASVLGLKAYCGTSQSWDTTSLAVGDILNNIDSTNTIKVLSGEELTIQKMGSTSISVTNATTTVDTVVEGVNIKVVKPDERYTPYRLAYINQHGGTDYITFTKADRESISIKRSYYSNDNLDNIYDTDVNSTVSVYSDYFTPEQSKLIKHLWISPKVVHIKDGNAIPINIQNKSVKVLRRRESGLIRYMVQFKYAEKYNIQK